MQNISELASWAQIISLPIAIIAIAVSVLLWRRSRQRRALACIFDPIISPIEVKVDEEFVGDLEIRYKGRPIKSLFLVRAKLINIGNVPIRESDVVEPIEFTVESDAKFLRPPQILNKKPENLSINALPSIEGRVTYEGTGIYLGFVLLNPGDEFTAEFVCTGRSQIPHVTARIEGVREIELLDAGQMYWREPRQIAKVTLFLFLTAIIVTVIIFISSLSEGTRLPLAELVVIFLIVFSLFSIVGLVLPISGVYFGRKRENRTTR